ncbi:ferritin family protein [bacterium]|nr:ferritin family protein [bacterium]
MAKTFESVNDALDFAIANEIEAHDMYMDLANKVERPEMREVFQQFAKEELGHKAKLEHVKAGGELKPVEGKIQTLAIADYTVDIEPKDNPTYQEALLIAMQAEKRAFKLYTDLAGQATDPVIVELFRGLAQEEAKHKLRFEIEYDDNILTEN